MVVRVAWNSVHSSVNSVWVVPREGGESEVSSAVSSAPVSMHFLIFVTMGRVVINLQKILVGKFEGGSAVPRVVGRG
jgi:hypothetical protein